MIPSQSVLFERVGSLDSLLVSLALGVVLGLGGLVADGVLGSRGTDNMLARYSGLKLSMCEDIPSADASVGVLGNLLVGLLGGGGSGLLNLLRDVVGTLLDGIHCDVWWLVDLV